MSEVLPGERQSDAELIMELRRAVYQPVQQQAADRLTELVAAVDLAYARIDWLLEHSVPMPVLTEH